MDQFMVLVQYIMVEFVSYSHIQPAFSSLQLEAPYFNPSHVNYQFFERSTMKKNYIRKPITALEPVTSTKIWSIRCLR